MTRARRGGLLLILLSSVIVIVWGSALVRATNGRSMVGGMGDFKIYFGASRCLLQHSDPYSPRAVEGVYRAMGWEIPRDPVQFQGATVDVNLPTTFILIAPFAMLPWGAAHLLWMTLTAASLTLAAILFWIVARNRAPGVSLFLICFLLANCEMVFASGNAGGVVVSLCAIAVWCFLEERFVPAGILCMAVSLAIKPHDVGLVWLYFLLAGGALRKRALQSLAVTVVLGLSAFLWVSHVAPNWMQEWRSNMAALSAPGGLNQPGPASVSSQSANMVVDLQAVVSIFWKDPHIYNPVSYAVCGALLLVWSVCTFRLPFSKATAWLSLAAIVPLSMLVTYHRPYDAKLILLTVPACAMLWAEGGPIGWIALSMTTAGVVLTGDIPLAILSILARNLNGSAAGIPWQLLTMVLLQPASLILLLMGIFYLWVYSRRSITSLPTGPRNSVHESPETATA